MFGNYRDCKEWVNAEMPLHTSSNEACKMYHATITQICTRQDDPSIGGLATSVQKTIEADPNFVMGHVVQQYFDTMKPVKEELKLTQWQELSNMEKGHVKALEFLSKGYDEKACNEWEKILVEYPKDFLALKMLYGYRLTLGEFIKQRDDVAKVLPYYKRGSDIEYGYVTGMHAFSLQETNFYDKAEVKAKEALNCDRHDAWASHSMAHIYDMTSEFNKGIEFLTATQSEWEIIKPLACHIHWHNTLYYVEKGDDAGALSYYDKEILTRVNATGGMFQLSDATALLYRLKMRGINVGTERWRQLEEHIEKQCSKHQWAFYDSCIMLGLCGLEKYEKADSFLKSLRDLVESGNGTLIQKVGKAVTADLCTAIKMYGEGQYEEAVDLLMPIRYKLIQLGGSHAQRDVFNLLLISAALKSPKPEHQKLSRQLVFERKALKDTPLTQSLLAQTIYTDGIA